MLERVRRGQVQALALDAKRNIPVSMRGPKIYLAWTSVLLLTKNDKVSLAKR